MEEEYTTLLREGTDRQQLGAAVGVAQMDSNNSSPSWDEASQYEQASGINEAGAQDYKNNSLLEWDDKESSFAEESDASSIIVKTVKRKPKHSSKISSAIS